MANWYVIRDGADVGPFDDAGLRQMALAEQLDREESVRKEGMDQPVTAGSIKGLFPATAPPPSQASNATDQTPSTNPPVTPPSTFERLRGTAQGVARAAAIKKLQLHDLPQADFAIGLRALQLSLAGDGLARHFAEIRCLEVEVESKQQGSVAPDHETLGDRTKRLAGEAKKRVDAELLLKKRKQLLTDVGRQIREGSDAAAQSQLAGELSAARTIENKLRALEAEDVRTGSGASLWRRLILAGALIPALLIGLWLLKDFITTSPEEQHQATLDKIRSDAEARRIRDDARRVAEDRKEKEEQERQAAELKQEEADLAAKLARQKREATAARLATELAREQARILKQEEESAEATEREANQRAMAAQEAADQKREELRLREEHDKAQTARAELADSLFANVSLDPNATFELSASAKKAGAKLELRSSELATLQKVMSEKNWLGLISYLNDASYQEYPEALEIERAFVRLQDREFHLLVLIDRRRFGDNGPQLCRIAFPADRQGAGHSQFEYPDVANITASWEVHPDGIGVTRIWRLTDGPAVVALADSRRIDEGINQVEHQLAQQYLSLDKKAQLGEISGDSIAQEMRKAVADAQAKLKIAALKL